MVNRGLFPEVFNQGLRRDEAGVAAQVAGKGEVVVADTCQFRHTACSSA